jgi:hypothetical protein
MGIVVASRVGVRFFCGVASRKPTGVKARRTTTTDDDDDDG